MPVTSPTASTLVGRDHAVATLRAEAARTRDSRGGLVLVSGEPGIGKTTLVTEALRHLEDPEVIVAAGAAWDGEGAPDYWPWTQVLRALRHHLGPTVWEDVVRTSGETLQAVLGDGPPPTPDLSDVVRFRIHDAVASALVTVSRQRPVVVLLDDLHRADGASLDLLEFLVRHAWFERVLVIGTLRDLDVTVAGSEHPLAARVRRLAPKATTIALAGLDRAEVATLLGRLSGAAVSDEVARDVHQRTGGNPFFVQELASLWRGGTLPETVPPGVEAVVGARLGQLPDDVVELLRTAAVIGREFSRRVLARATGRDERGLETPLDLASTAHLLVPRGRDRHAFQHDLVRETLLEGLRPEERRRTHAAVVTALDDAVTGADRAAASERAGHAYLAVPEVAPERALSLLLAAADDARGRLASHELARHLERALELVPEARRDLRATVALDLGDALHGAGDLAAARAVFEREVAVARQRGAARDLARAALGLHGLGLPDPDEDWRGEADLLDEALAALERRGSASATPRGDADGEDEEAAACAALHPQVLAASGRVRAHRSAGDPVAEERTSRAIRLAADAGDDRALATGLLARHDAIWRPGTAPERVALAEQLEQVGDRIGDASVSLQGLMLRIVALLEQGDPVALELHAEFVRRVERSGLPRYRFLALSRTGAFATLRGDFDEARLAIDDALALGERLEEVDRHRLWLEQRWALALRHGDLDGAQRLVDRHHELAGTYAAVTRAVTVAAAGGSTDSSPADRERLTRSFVRVRALAAGYPGMFGASLLHAQSRLAIASGDPGSAATARASLSPLRGSWAVVAGGGAIYGPYSLLLGQLAAVEGRLDEAIDDLEQAVDEAERLDARPWAIDARLAAARARRERGAEGDAAAAAALLQRARDDAADIGLDHLVTAVDAAAADAGAPGVGSADVGSTDTASADVGSTDTAPADTDGVSRFQPDGEVWTLGFAGRTVRVPATKGLKDLHVLIGVPGVEVPAVELLDPEGGAVVRATKQFGGDPVLDAEARETYRRRLTDLDTLIERATARHDDEQAARLDQEREALLDELRRATGFGGRPRRLGDEAERARKTVTARIRDTMRRLDEQHPELAEHLRASIATGATCRYRPTRAVTWQL